MKITGKSGAVYEVEWERLGFTWASPVILKRRWWWWSKRIKLNAPHSTKSLLQAQYLMPEEVRSWFQYCIDYYEKHRDSWAKERA